MANAQAREWLKSGYDDLRIIEYIINNAKTFYHFAQNFFDEVCQILGIELPETRF